MRSKSILTDLINYLEEFENESNPHQDLTTKDFVSFLLSKNQPAASKRDEIAGDQHEMILKVTGDNAQNADISILVSTMFRYAKMYIKKALKNSKLNSADDFSFLITLMTHPSMTKKELIGSQVFEKTSGMEIINRMVKFGFMSEYQDDKDKRSMRVTITPDGINEIVSVLPQMRKVSQIVAGTLTENEKTSLNNMLRKLDHFHNDIYFNHKDEELEKLISKISVN